MNKNAIVIASTAVFSLTVGAVGGYFFAKKQLIDAYQSLLEEEIENTRAYYRQQSQTAGFETSFDAAKALLADETVVTVQDFQALARELGYAQIEDVEEAHKIVQNIFDAGEEPDEDPETIEREEAARSDAEPYIISVEEYMHSETGYRQFTLTYFEGDDTLVDEHEKPVDEVARYVGDGNLSRFGHRSKNRNEVYIRNDKAELEFEVIRSQRSFTGDVLGFTKPSKKAQPRMRSADV